MQDWRPQLALWVHGWGRLDELTRDCFPLRPPSGSAWPTGIPDCQALADFYATCDGGTFGQYELTTLAELSLPADTWLADSPGFDLKPGQFLRLGDHEFGPALFWDAEADEVLLYSPDDMATRRLKRTVEEFLSRLFWPSSKSKTEMGQLWAEALEDASNLP